MTVRLARPKAQKVYKERNTLIKNLTLTLERDRRKVDMVQEVNPLKGDKLFCDALCASN